MNKPINGHGAALIIDPDAPYCFNCSHAHEMQLPPPNLGRVRVCKLLPPTPLAMRGPQNQITGFASSSPIVRDDDFCSHFDRQKIASEGKSQGANDDTVLLSDPD